MTAGAHVVVLVEKLAFVRALKVRTLAVPLMEDVSCGDGEKQGHNDLSSTHSSAHLRNTPQRKVGRWRTQVGTGNKPHRELANIYRREQAQS